MAPRENNRTQVSSFPKICNCTMYTNSLVNATFGFWKKSCKANVLSKLDNTTRREMCVSEEISVTSEEWELFQNAC